LPWKLEEPESLPVKHCVALFDKLTPFLKIVVLDQLGKGLDQLGKGPFINWPFIYFFYHKLPESMQERFEIIHASVKKEHEGKGKDFDFLVKISLDRYKRELSPRNS